MKVSLIIPVYNVERYVKSCLLSVLNQTYNNLEIIIVDDCSPDSSMTIIYDILSAHKNAAVVKIFRHEINKGLSEARNTGIKVATGDYLFFVDSDDILTKDCIETLVKSAERYNADLIIGNVLGLDISGNERLYLTLNSGLQTNKEEIRRFFFDRSIYAAVWNKLMKRDFVLKHNLFFEEGLIYEDQIWSFVAFHLVNSIYIENKVTYMYRMNVGLCATTSGESRICNYLKNVELMERYLNENPLFKSLHAIVFIDDFKSKIYAYYFLNNYSFKYKLFIYKKLRGAVRFNYRMYKAVAADGGKLIKIHLMLPEKIGFIYLFLVYKTYCYCRWSH